MEEPAKNEDIMKTLLPSELKRLIVEARCLACVLTEPCITKTFHDQCINGFQEWLKKDADVENWKRIREIISEKD